MFILEKFKNIGVQRSFEKNETATVFFLEKPFQIPFGLNKIRQN